MDGALLFCDGPDSVREGLRRILGALGIGLLGLLHPLVRRQVVIEGPQLGTVHLHRVPAPPPAGECLQIGPDHL